MLNLCRANIDQMVSNKMVCRLTLGSFELLKPVSQTFNEARTCEVILIAIVFDAGHQTKPCIFFSRALDVPIHYHAKDIECEFLVHTSYLWPFVGMANF